ncbi:MAG: DNRLRE domain-containing protein, partial [Clostridia bacterium]
DITALEDVCARYIVIKTTNGENAKAPTICEAEVYGWRLSSEVYTIDEEEHIIYMPEDTLLSEALDNLVLIGSASMTIDPNAAWVGDFVTVADEYGNETVYSVRDCRIHSSELISDYTLYDDGNVVNTELRASGKGSPYPAASVRYAVVKFDISGLTTADELLSARLSLYLNTKGNKGSPLFTVYSAEDADNPGADIAVTQYQSDFSQNDAGTSYGTLNVGKWFSFDVGTAISAAMKEGKTTIAFVVAADTCSNNFAHSSLGSDTAPRLSITTTMALLSADVYFTDGGVTVSLTNNTAQSYDEVLIFAAVYNSVGELADVMAKETELKAGTANKEIFFEGVESDKVIKVFIWNKALSPIFEPFICKNFSIPY